MTDLSWVIYTHHDKYITFDFLPLQSQQLLKYLILEKAGDLRGGIASLDAFPDRPAFKECRAMQQKLKYAGGPFTLKQVGGFTFTK